MKNSKTVNSMAIYGPKSPTFDPINTPPAVPAPFEKETVNHPKHYNMHNIEVIDFIEDWDLDFNSGNVIKYICRAPHKGKALEDLKKARFYLEREIAKIEKESTDGSQS